MVVVIPTVEAYLGTMDVAFELTTGRIRHGVEMSRNLRVMKASKQPDVSVTVCGWDFRSKAFNGAVRSLK
jgi:hypothetical protein